MRSQSVYPTNGCYEASVSGLEPRGTWRIQAVSKDRCVSFSYIVFSLMRKEKYEWNIGNMSKGKNRSCEDILKQRQEELWELWQLSEGRSGEERQRVVRKGPPRERGLGGDLKAGKALPRANREESENTARTQQGPRNGEGQGIKAWLKDKEAKIWKTEQKKKWKRIVDT